MSADWKPGDLALCVDDSLCEVYPGSEGGVTRGAVYHVQEVRLLKDIHGNPHTGLLLDRHNPVHPKSGRAGFHNHVRFRKINPHTPDAEDRETIELLNRKPAEVVQ